LISLGASPMARAVFPNRASRWAGFIIRNRVPGWRVVVVVVVLPVVPVIRSPLERKGRFPASGCSCHSP
jgi:hypothetical protein